MVIGAQAVACQPQNVLARIHIRLAEGGMAREATAIANEHFQFGNWFYTRPGADWEEAWKIAGMWAGLEEI